MTQLIKFIIVIVYSSTPGTEIKYYVVTARALTEVACMFTENLS